MSDKDNITHILDRFGSTRRTDRPAAATPASGKQTYQAGEVDRTKNREARLRILYSNGEIEVYPYSLLLSTLSVSPDRLGLLFTNGAIFMTGVNLRRLIEDFQDERVRVIQCFDPEIHETPAEDDPIIETIEWMTNDDIQKNRSDQPASTER